MAFIGNSSTQQAFTPAVDYFSGNGSTTAFTLSRPVASVAQVQVVIDNVAQNPSSAYTVSANTITFTSAPLSGTNNIYVYYTSPITQVIAPGQGTVNTTALGNITNIASGNSSLTLQTGSGNTTAVTVDTSQNVGIGTTPSAWGSAYKALQIGGGASGNFLNFQAPSQLISCNAYFNGSNYVYQSSNYAGISDFNGASAGGFAWRLAASGTAGNTPSFIQAMTIDSSGRVTQPYQTTFAVKKSTDYNFTTGDTQVVFNTIYKNDFSAYSTSTGLFTAPITAWYVFNFNSSITYTGSSNYNAVYVWLNGSPWAQNFRMRAYQSGAASGSWDSITGSWMMYLSANDTVSLYGYDSVANAILPGGEITWSGYLLG
jgi:hypothetical protein